MTPVDSQPMRPSLPAAVPSSFAIPIPTLSRGTADRSEDLKEPHRLREQWSRARVVVVDEVGRVEIDRATSTLRTVDALSLSPQPPDDAVLLGAIDDVDHWAVRGAVADGGGLRQFGSLLSDSDAGLLTTATALLTWHAAAGFCPRCGRPTAPVAAGWSRLCPQGHEDFPRTDPAVIVLVHDGQGSMVLARQPIWPPGRMSVLAGFVEAGESLEGAVAREVHEEIGVRVTDVSYLGSQPWPFPRSLMVGFVARAEPGAELRPRPGEIEDARWFDRDAIWSMLTDENGGWGTSDPAVDSPATDSRVDDVGQTVAGPVSTGPEDGYVFTLKLPDPVSIAHRMIHGWALAERG